MDWINNVPQALNSNWLAFSWLTAVFIFLAYFVLDTMYVKYTLAVVERNPVAASNFGSLMYVLMAFGIFNYTHNFLYVIPVGLGSWLGTYVVVLYEKNKAVRS